MFALLLPIVSNKNHKNNLNDFKSLIIVKRGMSVFFGPNNFTAFKQFCNKKRLTFLFIKSSCKLVSRALS